MLYVMQNNMAARQFVAGNGPKDADPDYAEFTFGRSSYCLVLSFLSHITCTVGNLLVCVFLFGAVVDVGWNRLVRMGAPDRIKLGMD